MGGTHILEIVPEVTLERGRLIPGFLSGINLAGLRSPLRLAEKVMHQLVSTFGTFARGRHEVTCADKGLR